MTKSFHPYPSEAFKSLWAVPPWPWQTFILIPDLLLEGSLIHSTVLVLFICQPLLGNGKFHLNLARQDLLRTLSSSCRHWHLETSLDLRKLGRELVPEAVLLEMVHMRLGISPANHDYICTIEEKNLFYPSQKSIFGTVSLLDSWRTHRGTTLKLIWGLHLCSNKIRNNSNLQFPSQVVDFASPRC